MIAPARRLAGHLALTSLLLGGLFTDAGAQSTTLDEGAFRITVAGRAAGSESFSIRQSGTGPGATISARGNTSLDTAGVTEELRSALQLTGTSLQPTTYNLRVTTGERAEQIAGRIAAGRFIAKIVSPTGEELREYLASGQAVLIDHGIIHQYYFLARRMQGESMRIPIIIPRQGKQVTATAQLRGDASVTIGRQSIPARHLVVSPAGGDEVHLWIDEHDRILRLEIPARRLTALRTAVPRN